MLYPQLSVDLSIVGVHGKAAAELGGGAKKGVFIQLPGVFSWRRKRA
jgi:hypothetical protein